jgi:hypothetical protein
LNGNKDLGNAESYRALAWRVLLGYLPSNTLDWTETLWALWAVGVRIANFCCVCHCGGLSLLQALQAIASPPALIMAYGFPNGTPPPMPSSSSNISAASLSSGLPSVSIATVKHAAQGMLGRARGLYQRYSKDYVKRNDAAAAADSAASTSASLNGTCKEESAKGDGPSRDWTKMKLDEVDDVCLRAILET